MRTESVKRGLLFFFLLCIFFSFSFSFSLSFFYLVDFFTAVNFHISTFIYSFQRFRIISSKASSGTLEGFAKQQIFMFLLGSYCVFLDLGNEMKNLMGKYSENETHSDHVWQ